MGRISTIALALFVAHGLLAPSPVMAQPRDSWGSLVGNWNMEFAGKEGQPLAKGHFVFHADQTTQVFVAVTGPGAASGVFSETPPQYNSQYEQLPCKGSFVGGNLNLDCWPYGFFYLTLRLSADGNTLRGTWTNSRNGEPDGLVRWTRAKPPTIEKVEALSEDGLALDHAEMEQAWADGGRPQLRLRLQGRDLPIWIETPAEPRKDIAIDDPNYRIVREVLSISDLKERWKQGAFEVVVQLEPGARPGRKTITVNGSSKTFDVVFRNYPELAPPSPNGTIRIAYSGKIRDRVGQDTRGIKPDGAPDGTFVATVEAPGGRTITGLTLRSDTPGAWDTVAGTVFWALGVAAMVDGPLANHPDRMGVNFPVADRGSFVLFASDGQGEQFAPGRTVTLTATFSDGTTATGSTKISARSPLPPTGLLASRGERRYLPDSEVRRDCTCQSIALARVSERDIKSVSRKLTPPFGHKIVYGPFKTVYDLDDPALPPQAGAARFSRRKPRDQVWFYFSYPESMAYVTQARDHSCAVNINMDYPDTSSNTGRRSERFRPFVGQGRGGGQSAGTNVVSLTGSLVPEGTIGPGQARVEWTVQGRSCGTVRFVVD